MVNINTLFLTNTIFKKNVLPYNRKYYIILISLTEYREGLMEIFHMILLNIWICLYDGHNVRYVIIMYMLFLSIIICYTGIGVCQGSVLGDLRFIMIGHTNCFRAVCWDQLSSLFLLRTSRCRPQIGLW